MESDYLTPDEIAAKLRVNVVTVRRWLLSGELPSYRFGKQYRVTQRDFDEYLQRQKVRNTEQAGVA